MARHGLLCCVVLLGSSCAAPQKRVTVRVIEGRPQASPYASPGAYEHYLRAKLSAGGGDTSKAIGELRRALAFDSKSPFLHTELAALLASTGQRAAAYDHVERALAIAPQFPDAWRVRGDLAAQADQVERATSSYQQCIAGAPQSSDCYLRQARLLDKQRRPDQARAVLEQLVAQSSGRVGHRALARLCAQQLRLDCASKHFEAALRVQRNLPTVAQAAQVQRAMGRFDAAVTLLNGAYQSSRNSQIGEALLVTLTQLERHDAIDQLVDTLVRQSPSTEQRIATARLLLHHGLARRALAVEASADGTKDSPARWLLRADALARLQQTDASLALVHRAGEAGPLRADLVLWSAQVLTRLGLPKRATAELQELLEREPPHDNATLMLARLQADLGQSERAIALLQRATAAKPHDSRLKMSLALALHRGGRWQEGIAIAREVVRQQPANASAHNFIGYVLASERADFGQARRAIDQALRLSPLAPYIVDSLGWLYLKQGRHADALRVLQIAARLSPRDPEVLAHLAEVHSAQGRTEQALPLLKKAATLCADPLSCKRWKETARRLGARTP